MHSIPALRVSLLSELYGVTVGDLFDVTAGEARRSAHPDRRADGALPTSLEQLRLDVAALEHARGRDAEAAAHLVRAIQGRRRHRATESIVLRHEDLVNAADLLGRSVDQFVDALHQAGVLRRPRGRPERTS